MINAIKRVLDSGQYILGKEVEAFEREVADYYGMEYAIGCNSGTDALILSLEALGIGKGDEVITTPYTFIASAESIARVGAKPVFVDIDYDTFLIDPDKIEAAITENTKAILPVHLFGEVCDMARIMEIADHYNLKVIEDAAQCFGFEGLGKGDTLCFSFHPSKSLGGCGDGGIILTNNKRVDNKLRSLRNHGADLFKGPEGKYHNLCVGYNSRLDEIQAAILREKLKDFGKYGIKKLYTFRTPNRELVQQWLEENQVDNKIYYSKLLHLQPCFEFLGYEKGDLPVAEKAAEECLTINIYVNSKRDNKV